MRKLLYSSFSFLLLIACLSGCIEDPDPAGGILNAALPSVVLSVEGMNATSITVKVEVSAENGAPVSVYGVCWTTSPDILPTIANDTLIAGRGKGSFTLTIDNLTPKTEYYLRPFATNIAGTGYPEGKTKVLTEEGLGKVRTLEVVDLTATTAECGGKIELTGELDIIERGIILKDLTNPLAEDAVRKIKIEMETDSFYCTVTDLKPATDYYVEAYVLDKLNRSYLVNETDSVKFTTFTGLPEIGEVKIEAEYESAELIAEILNIGNAPLQSRGFVFGTTENVDQEGDSLKIEVDQNGNNLGIFKVIVDELESNERYYVKAYASNAFGFVETETKYFYTKQDVPRLSFKLETFANGEAILTGKMEDSGRSPMSEIGICWNTTGVPEKDENKEVISLDGDHEFTFKLEKIVGGYTYYIRAYADNDYGTGYSDVIEFTAPARFTTQQADFKGDAGRNAASFIINNIFYLVGGDAGKVCTDQLITYNPSSVRWWELTPLPKEVGGVMELAACSHGETGYIMGGIDKDENVFEHFYTYDKRNNKWISYGVIPEKRYGGIGVSTPGLNSVYLIGGRNESKQNTSTIYQYAYGEWQEAVGTFKAEISNGVAFEYDKKLYVGLGSESRLWYTDISSGYISSSWEEAAVLDRVSSISTAVVYNENAYMIDSEGVIVELNLETHTWNKRGTFPKSGMLDYHMFVLQDKIYILGQSLHHGSMLITYDPVWDPVTD